MMDTSTLIEKFSSIIEEDYIILKAEANTKITVTIDTFSTLFNESDLTYASLMNVNANNGYGYREYIDEWKRNGLIE